MALVCRCVLLWIVLLAAEAWSLAASAPSPPEDQAAFKAADKFFQDGFYKQAEAEFARFAQKYTNSSLLPEAILYQAQARIKTANYTGALELLSAHQGQAGKRADEYLFWTAESLSQKGDAKAAADTFGRLAREFSGSPRRLEAAIREMGERVRLDEWPRVLDLLQDTNAVFQSSIRAGLTNEMVARGYLLLAEGCLRKGAFEPAQQALERIQPLSLNPRLSWQRQFLLCRVWSLTGHTDQALQGTTNLLSLAASIGQPALRSDSVMMQAELLERLQRPAEAMQVYEKNLACDVGPDKQRQSLLKITAIAQSLNTLSNATHSIERFLAQCPEAESGDLAWLTLGQVRLRQHETGVPFVAPSPGTNANVAATNYLQLAIAAFGGLTNRFPQSPLSGKAHLDLGWCLWEAGRVPESLTAFQTAVQKLPLSPEQAVAWFKLGDAQYRLTNFAGAVTSYQAVVDKFAAFPDVTNTLFEPALYQRVRAGLAGHDEHAVTNALSQLLTWFPNGFHTDRAVLMAGPEIGRANPAGARLLFSEVETNTPGSPLLPELELAVARTYEQEGDWAEAINRYGSWILRFTNHPGLVRAEYCRAVACFRAHQDTNAFLYFTNFLARFPTNDWAPQAQWWVAGHYFRLGDMQAAEQNYQAIYQNWPATEISYQARMMAGRAAFERHGWHDAWDYFTKLVQDTNCPSLLRAQAWCALGDTFISQDSTNKLADYKDALNAFDQVFLCSPSNYMAALAWGKKANCLLQCAESVQDYRLVSNAFEQVLQAPLADAKARSIALVGLGVSLEKLAKLQTGADQRQTFEQALNRYLEVFYLKYLRTGEEPDPFWTRKAGLAAGQLAESMKLYSQALNIYLRLKDLFPPLRLESKIEALRAQTQQLGQAQSRL